MHLGSANQNDLNEIVDLMKVILPKLNRNRELLFWQYFQTPTGSAKLYTIREKDKIVSFYAAVAMSLRINEKIYSARMIQDVMTLPDYRGRGYLHHLAKACFKEMNKKNEIGFTFPNEKSHKSFIRTGWDVLAKVPLRELLISCHNNQILNLSEKLIELEDIKLPFSNMKNSKNLHPIIDEIWTQSGIQNSINRDYEYLNWRYSKPGEKYFGFLINNNAGFLVIKVFDNENQKIVHICDLIIKKNEQKLISEVLKFVKNYAVMQNAQKITAWCLDDNPYSQYFDNVGLRLVKNYNRTIFINAQGNSSPIITQKEFWHISQADSDVY